VISCTHRECLAGGRLPPPPPRTNRYGARTRELLARHRSLAESSDFRLRRVRPHELPEVQGQLLRFALILVHDLEWQFPPVSASAYCKGGKVIPHSNGTSQLWSIAQSTTFESASKSDYWRIQSQIRISKKLVTTLRILARRLPVLQFTWFPHFRECAYIDLDPNVMLPHLITL
jgi:hypothetical protein